MAALWTIRGDDGPTVRFQAGRLQDYLGNPIEGSTVRLTMAPVYAVGLSTRDAWYRQTAYSLDTPHLVPASGGDERASRGARHEQPRRADRLPHASSNCRKAGRPSSPKWRPASRRAKPRTWSFPSASPSPRPLGLKEVTIVVSEGEELKRMTLKVFVRSPLTVQVSSMQGRPGKTQVSVDVQNHSSKAISGVLRMHVPGSWKALMPEVPIAELKPQEVRSVVCPFEWNADWKPQERRRSSSTSARTSA